MSLLLQEILNTYLEVFPEERARLRLLRTQVKDHEVLNDRRNFRGHVTGSAIVLSPDRSKVLLIHHNLFKVWQQPGGHWETSELDPLAAAAREAEEETGVRIKQKLGLVRSRPLVPLDIDTHRVPPRPLKREPAHYHHDIRYVFVAASELLKPQEEEVSAAKWVSLDDPDTFRIARCIEKLRQFNFV